MKARSYQKELLDEANISKDELFLNLKELDRINSLLGGYAASRRAFRLLLKQKPGLRSLMDIGFGGGGSIRQLGDEAVRKSKSVFFYGVDVKEECREYAEKELKLMPNKMLICDDYRNIQPEFLREVDAVHCSLFLHHLNEEEILSLFRLVKENGCALIVNDLHRHPFAYRAIQMLTGLFSGSRLVRNDAPLSVKRGFKKEELGRLLKEAGFDYYHVSWSWAFRYIIVAQ